MALTIFFIVLLGVSIFFLRQAQFWKNNAEMLAGQVMQNNEAAIVNSRLNKDEINRLLSNQKTDMQSKDAEIESLKKELTAYKEMVDKIRGVLI